MAGRAVVSVLSDPGLRTDTTGSNRVEWLGSGLYVCSVCGQPALRISQTGGKYQPAYRCKAGDNTRQSGHVTRAAQHLDDYIERIIMACLHQPAATDLFTAPTGMDLDTTAMHTEAAAIAQRLTDLSAAFAEGVITLAQLRTGTGTLRARLTEIDDTLPAAARINPLIGLAGQPSIAEIWYGTTPERCDGLDIGRRRAVLATLFTVTMLSTSKGRRPTAPISTPPEFTSNGKHTDHTPLPARRGFPRSQRDK